MRDAAGEEADEFAGVGRFVIDAGQEAVFVGDAAARGIEVFISGLEDVGDADVLVDRDDFCPELVIGA